MKLKIFDITGFLMLFGSFVGMLFFAYLMFEPFRTPEISTPIPILNEGRIVRHGEAIKTKVTYCTFKKVSSTTSRRYESVGGDRRVYFLSTTESAGSDPKCATVENNSARVPSDIPPGRYKIILDATFKINPVKTVTKRYETEVFTVSE